MNMISIEVATAYNKYQFLGYEFLLWLWYLASKAPHMIREGAAIGKPVEITFGNSITLETRGNCAAEKLAIKGIDAGFEEAFVMLHKGGVIVQANMVLAIGGEMPEEFSFTLKGDDFSIRTFKCNPGIEYYTEDEIEGALMEKQFLTWLAFECLDNLFADFIQRRTSEHWKRVYVTAIREWISDRAGVAA